MIVTYSFVVPGRAAFISKSTDQLDEYLLTDIVITINEHYDPIQYWNDRFHTQPDLAQMALDALAVFLVWMN